MKFTALLNAALSAGALALPATNETEDLSTLERRANYGWVSSYAPSDPNCKGGWGGGRPKIKGSGCVKFQPISDHVGINWGSVSCVSLPFSSYLMWFSADLKSCSGH